MATLLYEGGVVMNIFILDTNPYKSVIYHTDKHIVKMPIESTQILCTVLHMHGVVPNWAYRPTHQSHPCVVWANESLTNWLWLQHYTHLLGEEYTYRYGNKHRSVDIAMQLSKPPLSDKGLTPFAKCVPDEFKSLSVVEAYRQYFIHYKNHIKQYTKRDIPEWWID